MLLQTSDDEVGCEDVDDPARLPSDPEDGEGVPRGFDDEEVAGKPGGERHVSTRRWPPMW